MSTAASAALIGAIDKNRVTATQEFGLGTCVIGSDNVIYTYVTAGGAIAASQTDITVSTAFSATDGSGTNTGPNVAVASGQYFWAGNAVNAVDIAS